MAAPASRWRSTELRSAAEVPAEISGLDTILEPFGEAVIIASSTLGEILFDGLDCGGYGAQPCRWPCRRASSSAAAARAAVAADVKTLRSCSPTPPRPVNIANHGVSAVAKRQKVVAQFRRGNRGPRRATQPLVLPRLSAISAPRTSAGRAQKRRGRVKAWRPD